MYVHIWAHKRLHTWHEMLLKMQLKPRWWHRSTTLTRISTTKRIPQIQRYFYIFVPSEHLMARRLFPVDFASTLALSQQVRWACWRECGWATKCMIWCIKRDKRRRSCASKIGVATSGRWVTIEWHALGFLPLLCLPQLPAAGMGMAVGK